MPVFLLIVLGAFWLAAFYFFLFKPTADWEVCVCMLVYVCVCMYVGVCVGGVCVWWRCVCGGGGGWVQLSRH